MTSRERAAQRGFGHVMPSKLKNSIISRKFERHFQLHRQLARKKLEQRLMYAGKLRNNGNYFIFSYSNTREGREKTFNRAMSGRIENVLRKIAHRNLSNNNKGSESAFRCVETELSTAGWANKSNLHCGWLWRLRKAPFSNPMGLASMRQGRCERVLAWRRSHSHIPAARFHRSPSVARFLAGMLQFLKLPEGRHRQFR